MKNGPSYLAQIENLVMHLAIQRGHLAILIEKGTYSEMNDFMGFLKFGLASGIWFCYNPHSHGLWSNPSRTI